MRVLGEKRLSIPVFFIKKRNYGRNDQFLTSEVAKNHREAEIKPIDCYLCSPLPQWGNHWIVAPLGAGGYK